jgi:hypothetical protein
VSTLQSLFDDLVQAAMYRPFVALIERKINAAGHTISDRQRGHILRMLRESRLQDLRLSVGPRSAKGTLPIDITAAVLRSLKKELRAIMRRAAASIDRLSDHLELTILAHVKSRYPKDLRADAVELRGFEKRLRERWKPALELLALVIESSVRIGYEVMQHVSASGYRSPTLAHVVVRLHARGIRVAKEVMVLLTAGYADGAMARWRTLHETAVVAAFLVEHGEDCAKCYLDYEAVESYSAARRYQVVAQQLGQPQLTEADLTPMREARAAAVACHGPQFGGDYGWACKFLALNRVHFSDLEARVELEYLRPYYRLASYSVHASPKAILFQLGTAGQDLVLTGPSNTGLADPAQKAGLTLALLTVILVQLHPSLDTLVGAKTTASLASEAGDLFVDIQNTLEAEGEAEEEID